MAEENVDFIMTNIITWCTFLERQIKYENILVLFSTSELWMIGFEVADR